MALTRESTLWWWTFLSVAFDTRWNAPRRTAVGPKCLTFGSVPLAFQR